MTRALPLALASLALLQFAGCGLAQPDPFAELPSFTEAQTLGGKSIDAQTLNRGRELYILNCYACHGAKGDGNGPAAPGLRPPPRNFKQGFYKFAATIDEEVVYQITAALWHDNARHLLDEGHAKGKDIRLGTALDGIAVPLHPGAERYYREIGLAK